MLKPEIFIRLLNLSGKLRLVNRSVLKFVNSYLTDAGAREQLFNRWTCMRTFTPDIKTLRNILGEKQVPVRLLYGKHDQIIQARRSVKLSKQLTLFCETHIIDAGHQVLHQKYAEIIIKLMLG